MKNETFLYERKPFKNGNINVRIAFPGVYNLGMSSLGFLSVFKIYDTHENVNAERIFTDTKDTELYSQYIDIFAFSVSFELDFLQIFKILDKFSIPFRACDRDDSYPLISGGGPVLSCNPEPYAPIFDYIEIGDAENTTKKVIEAVKNSKDLTKRQKLHKLSEIPGVYVPSLCEFVEGKGMMKDGEPYFVEKSTAKLEKCLATPILTPNTYFKNMYIIETGRGCPQKCNFCATSFLNSPFRPCPKNEIYDCIETGLKHTNKIAFLGAAVAAHPNFEEICDFMYKKAEKDETLELGVSSLRADFVSDNVARTLVKCGQKHATIALEAGNDKLRNLINKNLTDEQIFSTVEIMARNGFRGVKIYAMTGLPGETEDDVKDLIECAKKIKQIKKGFDVVYTLSDFVPKAHTPFWFAPFENTKSLEKKSEFIKKEMHKAGITARCSSPDWSAIQALISRGDRRLCEYLIQVYAKGGNKGAFKSVRKEFEKEKYITDFDEIIYKEKNKNFIHPSDFITLKPGKPYISDKYENFKKCKFIEK